jgi:hypothetical protein
MHAQNERGRHGRDTISEMAAARLRRAYPMARWALSGCLSQLGEILARATDQKIRMLSLSRKGNERPQD